jgi:hypothetical protein
MASPLSRALRVPVLVVLALSAITPSAYAVEERAWVSLGVSGVMYDAEQGLKDNLGYDGRASFFLNRWLGLEGIVFYSHPDRESPAVGKSTLTHFGGGLILTPDRYRWTIPYLYAGLGSAKLDLGLPSTKSNSAVHIGAGIVARAGERLGFRLDGRNVSYDQVDGAGNETRVNDIMISGSVAAFWAGRPRHRRGRRPRQARQEPDTARRWWTLRARRSTPTRSRFFDGLDKSPSRRPWAPRWTGERGHRLTETACRTALTSAIPRWWAWSWMRRARHRLDGDKVFDGLDKCPDTPGRARSSTRRDVLPRRGR